MNEQDLAVPSIYPRYGESLILLVLLLLGQGVSFGLLTLAERASGKSFSGHPLVMAAGSLFGFFLANWFASRKSGLGTFALLSEPGRNWTCSGLQVCALTLTVFGQLVALSGVTELIMPEMPESMDVLAGIDRTTGRWDIMIGLILLLVVVAPFTEEIIFRGRILRGFIGNYAPRKALAVSAILFAAVHLNPWQFPITLTLGMLSGWLYLRVGSIWPSILCHALNNLVPTLLLVAAPVEEASANPSVMDQVALILFGICLWISGLFFLHQLTEPSTGD